MIFGMSTDPVIFEKPTTLRTRVEDFLRTAIMEGRIQGGERLREVELCETLGVSRPTLREAMRTLEAERLITIEPHRGPSVIRIDEKAAGDMYAMRALLEGFAAQEFARRADAAQLARLHEAVARFKRAAEPADRQALLAAKREFYDVLLTGAGNELVKETLTGLLSRINLLRATSFTAPDRLPRSVAEIELIVERIAARDSAGARAAAEAHIRSAETAALAVLRQQAAHSAQGA